jgi:peptidoglycan/LPS O-acetylase OafA/YrhL
LSAFVAYRRDLDLGQGWGTSNFLVGFPRVFFGFSLGVLLYNLRYDASYRRVSHFFERHVRSPWPLYLLLLTIFAVPTNLHGWYPMIMLATAAPCLVFVGSMIACRDRFDLAIARFLGWISFPVYCLHFPIARAVFLVADGNHVPKAQAVFISIAVTLAVAIVLTKLYEEPTRAYLTRKLLAYVKTRKVLELPRP